MDYFNRGIYGLHANEPSADERTREGGCGQRPGRRVDTIHRSCEEVTRVSRCADLHRSFQVSNQQLVAAERAYFTGKKLQQLVQVQIYAGDCKVGYMCSRLIIPGLCPICDCAYNIEAIQASRSCALRVLKVICEKRVPISKTNERQSLGVACRRERDADSAACKFMRKYRRRSYDQEYVFRVFHKSFKKYS